MIIDVLEICLKQGKRAAFIDAYQQLLDIDRDPDFSVDLLDVLENAASIPMFQNGRWVLWLQQDEDIGERGFSSVQFQIEDQLKAYLASDYAPHVSSLDSELVTLAYHARKPPLPEATDISHPKWQVINTCSSPSEIRFDLQHVGGET